MRNNNDKNTVKLKSFAKKVDHQEDKSNAQNEELLRYARAAGIRHPEKMQERSLRLALGF